MGLDNHIETVMKSVLRNPILSVLKEINITKFLKQSNFVKQEVGYSTYMILLHFVYMLVIHKRQSQFRKQKQRGF